MDQIDFLPERIRLQRARQRRIVRQGYLLIVCVMSMIFLGYFRQERVNRAHGELVTLHERAGNIKHQLEMRDALERQKAELLIIKRIEEDLGSRVNVLDMLAELERVIPASVSLTNMEIKPTVERIPIITTNTTAGPSRAVEQEPKEKVIKRVQLVFTGLSPNDVDVANFIGQLSASSLFEDVNMKHTRKTLYRDRQAREFQGSCYVIR